ENFALIDACFYLECVWTRIYTVKRRAVVGSKEDPPPTSSSNVLLRLSKLYTSSSQSGRNLTAFASIMKENDHYAAREKGIGMVQGVNQIEVYLEIGQTRTFAITLDWPGWCR